MFLLCGLYDYFRRTEHSKKVPKTKLEHQLRSLSVHWSPLRKTVRHVLGKNKKKTLSWVHNQVNKVEQLLLAKRSSSNIFKQAGLIISQNLKTFSSINVYF